MSDMPKKFSGYIAIEAIISVSLLFVLSISFYAGSIALYKNAERLSDTLNFYRRAKEGREQILASQQKEIIHEGVMTSLEFGEDGSIIGIKSQQGQKVLEVKLK